VKRLFKVRKEWKTTPYSSALNNTNTEPAIDAHNEAIEFYVGKLSFRSGRIDFPRFINRGIAI